MFDKDMLARLRAERKEWEAGRHSKAPDSPGERGLYSELPKKPLYTPEDLAADDMSDPQPLRAKAKTPMSNALFIR